jgi:hypothetical protein
MFSFFECNEIDDNLTNCFTTHPQPLGLASNFRSLSNSNGKRANMGGASASYLAFQRPRIHWRRYCIVGMVVIQQQMGELDVFGF